MSWYIKVLKNYAVFSGRARRKEYWMFVLFNLIFYWALFLIEKIVGISPGSSYSILATIYSLAVLVPGLAVAVRRLHDTNRNGWWLLIALVPIVGAIILLVFLATDGQPGENQYGPNPKSGVAIAT
jgi:uncharacterized membrane protein YhaH (DUF805 family)